ncbi:MAG TPA: hypothetical protein VEK79_14670 [Thermoanaerobaculia bacterium]|nr:hypothetical protein [Thermoanaerobaculia bacterium]
MTFAPQEPQAPWEQKTTRPDEQARQSRPAKRTRGEDPAPAPGHSTRHLPANFREINGWGADLDHKNRPSYPKELPSTVKTARGDVKHWQTPRTKVHMSNEHPGLTPVFGESVPPSGLSGHLRDYAYQYGEATNRHWMTLMFADRVNVIERAIIDAFRGRPDNYVREKGWSGKLKYEDSDPRKKALFVGAAAIGVVALALVLFNALHED